MKTFPMFLTMAGRRVLILGGGEQAVQKCRLMLKTEAAITVQAPDLDPELAALVASGRVTHETVAPSAAGCAGMALVFIGTGCPGCDAALYGLAKAAGAVVNVVDQPGLCDALTPSLVDRDPVVVAIGTEGTAPVLGQQIRVQVEQMLEPRLGALARIAGEMRDRVAFRLPKEARRGFWRWVFFGAPRQRHAAGDEDGAEALIAAAIDAGGLPEAPGALLSLIPSDGIAAHLTLEAVSRLQAADLMLHAPGITAPLELARRDAERATLTPDAVAAATAEGARVAVLHTPGADTCGLAEAAAPGTTVERLAGVGPAR